MENSNKILEALEKIAKTEGFTKFEINAPEIFQKGEGFLSDQFSVAIKEKDSGKQLKLIIKQAFITETIRLHIPVRQSFLTEIFFYSNLIPEFKKLDPDYEIIAPKCYAYSKEEQNEYLILEDLRVKNFKNYEKSKNLREDYVKFVLKRYGKFHALSYAVKENNPNLVEDLMSYADVAKEILKKEWVGFLLKEIIETVQDGLNKVSEKDIFDKLTVFREQVEDIVDLSTENDTDDYMTFLHGDCWSNNLLFKINQEGILEDIRLIDFQLLRIGSPVCDLSYFLYSGVGKNELDKLDELLKIYHESLIDNAEKLGCNMKNIIPFDELQKQWPKYSKYGFLFAAQTIKAKLQEPKGAKNLKDFEEIFENLEEGTKNAEENYELAKDFIKYDKDEYKKRMIELVRHMYEVQGF